MSFGSCGGFTSIFGLFLLSKTYCMSCKLTFLLGDHPLEDHAELKVGLKVDPRQNVLEGILVVVEGVGFLVVGYQGEGGVRLSRRRIVVRCGVRGDGCYRC